MKPLLHTFMLVQIMGPSCLERDHTRLSTFSAVLKTKYIPPHPTCPLKIFQEIGIGLEFDEINMRVNERVLIHPLSTIPVGNLGVECSNPLSQRGPQLACNGGRNRTRGTLE